MKLRQLAVIVGGTLVAATSIGSKGQATTFYWHSCS